MVIDGKTSHGASDAGFSGRGRGSERILSCVIECKAWASVGNRGTATAI
jgi:hypothetical protein